jgi:molybdopterin-guanine dinucleotide biosynthesis protein A
MGRDKARLAVGGTPAAVRVAGLLAALVEDVVLVGGDPPADAPGRRVPDPPGPACALRGLVGGLAAARAERVFVVATDLPLVTSELLLGLLAWPEAEAVVPWPAQGPQPLCALYQREATLARARTRLADGRLALKGLLKDLRVSPIGEEALAGLDPEGMTLANLNTPEELERIERWLAARAASP